MARNGLISCLLYSLLLVSLMSHAGKESSKDPSLTLTRLTGTIKLLDGKPPVAQLKLEISNQSDQAVSFKIGFKDTDALSTGIAANATQTLAFEPQVQHAGNSQSLQKALINLALLINGRPAPSIDEVAIKVHIPDSAYPLVSTEPALMDNGKDPLLAPYEYFSKDRQVTPLTLLYNPGPSNISIRKTIYPIPVNEGPVKVMIELVNHGKQAVTNFMVQDTLMDKDFLAEGSEFKRYINSKTQEVELVWEQHIDQLAAGEHIRLSYQVKARHKVEGLELDETTAIKDNQLISSSNRVWLPKWF